MQRSNDTNPTSGRGRSRRWLAAAGALAAGVAGLTATPARPAAASSVTTTFTETSPVTWIDGAGRQLVLVTASGSQLTILRDTPSGEPDPTWGTNGLRTVQPAYPDGAVSTSKHIAADDDGRLTIVFQTAGCSGALPCDRWFQQVDATGATVSDPTLVEDVPPTWRTLEDGSLLLGAAGTPIEWHGPDGAERQLLPLLTDDVVHTDVDSSGRLLALTADGTVHRYPADGGAADLTVATPCDAVPATGTGAAVGASAHAPGFAVACPVAGEPTLAVYGAGGSPDWSLPGGAASAPAGTITDVTLTPDGRAWVATLTIPSFLAPSGLGKASVTPAASTGWQAAAYQRSSGGSNFRDLGGGVVSLRTTGASEVAIADLQVCCQYSNNATARMAAHAAIVPYRPGPPLTRPGTPSFRLTRDHGLVVSFTGAPWVAGRANRNAEEYRVDVDVDGATATVTAPDTGSGARTEAGLADVAGGRLVTATVTARNDHGDGILGPSTGATITPFRSVGDFVDHQAATLHGGPLTSAERASAIESLTEGGHAPGSFMEELLGTGTELDAVEPAARLYRAAFLRDPDIGGLRYWVDRRRDGVRLAAIAEHFARSSEFQRRYGTLTNRRYVERIYQNVLGRAGDPAGIGFWTARLDSRRATRGSVLAGFSESGEFVRKTNGIVQPLTVTFLMLDRRPTTAEKAAWSTAEGVYADMPVAILDTPGYIDRIAAR